MATRKTGMVIGFVVLAVSLLVIGYYGSVQQAAKRRFVETQLRMRQWDGNLTRYPNATGLLEPLRGLLGSRIVNEFAGSDGNSVASWNTSATKEQLAEALEHQPIRTAMFGGNPNLGDDWVLGIREPAVMTFLALDGTTVSDRSLDRLLEMKNLQLVSLVDTAISDDSVARLLRLPKLGEIYVGGPNIKAIRLIDCEILDDSGLPATKAGEILHFQGNITVDGLSGTPGYVRVMARIPSDKPPNASVPYGWNASRGELVMPVEIGPGKYSFKLDLPNLPVGRSSVEVWVDYRTAKQQNMRYRLDQFAIDLVETPALDTISKPMK